MITTKQIGDRAETAAVDYLRQRGFMILGRNWRHRRAEIDIIASKHDTVYFVEVKHRRRQGSGRGLDYVTARKQRQMAFAADLWLVYHRWQTDYCLAAIETSGDEPRVNTFVAPL